MTNPNAILDLVNLARGSRPASLKCAEAEDSLAVTLALVTELCVANDRIDRLERMVAELRGESPEALRNAAYTGDAAVERQAATEALILRSLRIFFDPRQPAPRPDLANML